MKPTATRSATSAASLGPGWPQEALRRIKQHFLLKTTGICVFMWVFFQGYFHLLKHPASAVTVMPLTPLDHAVGFVPGALAAYVSLWLYVGMPAGLAASLREAIRYGLGAAAVSLTGLACFYFFPTAVPALDQGLDRSAHWGYSILQGIDASGNACPSLHVASAVFAAFWLDAVLRDMRGPQWARLASLCWVVLIVWSTMATKQHVALDVGAGLVLGGSFGWLCTARRRRPRWGESPNSG